MPRTLKIFVPALVLAIFLAPLLAGAADTSPPTPPKDPNYGAAEKAVKAGQYRDAIVLLDKVVRATPDNADAFNYLGFSHRKLGDFEKAMGFYHEALRLKPNHIGAHEYLGELYLQMNDLARAEEHLKRLDSICLFGCEEYSDLKKAIQAYRAKHSG